MKREHRRDFNSIKKIGGGTKKNETRKVDTRNLRRRGAQKNEWSLLQPEKNNRVGKKDAQEVEEGRISKSER